MESKEALLKRFFLAVVLGFLLITGCGGSRSEQEISVVSFKDAVAHPELRDTYVMQVAERVGTPFYVIVSYDDTREESRFLQETYGFQVRPGIAMAVNWDLLRLADLGKQQIPARASVFPEAFSGGSIETEEDFRSALLHEMEHVDTLQTGRIGRFSIFPTLLARGGKFNKDLVLSVMELEVLKNEIARQEISRGYFQSRANLYVENYLKLWEYGKDMAGGTIEDLKVEFFHRGMLTFPFFFREEGEGEEIWHFRDPSGKQYFLSREEIRKIKEKLRI